VHATSWTLVRCTKADQASRSWRQSLKSGSPTLHAPIERRVNGPWIGSIACKRRVAAVQDSAKAALLLYRCRIGYTRVTVNRRLHRISPLVLFRSSEKNPVATEDRVPFEVTSSVRTFPPTKLLESVHLKKQTRHNNRTREVMPRWITQLDPPGNRNYASTPSRGKVKMTNALTPS